MSFTLSNDEYNVLNKIACKTKMDCWFYIEQDKSGVDYVRDLEEEQRLSLKDGITQLVEGIGCKENFENCDLSAFEAFVFRNLLEELDIAFEMEGISVLPGYLTISASDLAVDSDDIFKDSDAISEIISDYLSDTYGFCHKGFTFDVNYNELNEPSSVFVTDIDWDVDGVEESRMGSDWVLTDPDYLQFRRQLRIDESKVFELIQVDIWPMDEKTSYKLAVGEIDLNDYTDEEIASMLDSYGYDDMAALVSAAGTETEAYGQLAEMFMEVYTTDFYVCEFDSWNAAVDEVAQRTGVDMKWLREDDKPLDDVIKSCEKVSKENEKPSSKSVERDSIVRE